MLPLRDVQAAFRDALLAGDEDAAAALVRGDGLMPHARLQIYRHHVFTTLTAALEATYPVVCRLVDARFFAYAADRYMRVQPPAGPCLFEYGDSFPEFLADFEPCRQLRYLPDVARLEWALHYAAHAGDAVPLDPARLRSVAEKDWPRLLLQFDLSLSLLDSRWPVDRIWYANQPDADPGLTVDLACGSAHLEVRRIGSDVVLRAIDVATHAFRLALHTGRCLEEAVGVALDIDGAFDLARALQDLIGENLLVGFALSPSSMKHEG